MAIRPPLDDSRKHRHNAEPSTQQSQRSESSSSNPATRPLPASHSETARDAHRQLIEGQRYADNRVKKDEQEKEFAAKTSAQQLVDNSHHFSRSRPRADSLSQLQAPSSKHNNSFAFQSRRNSDPEKPVAAGLHHTKKSNDAERGRETKTVSVSQLGKQAHPTIEELRLGKQSRQNIPSHASLYAQKMRGLTSADIKRAKEKESVEKDALKFAPIGPDKVPFISPNKVPSTWPRPRWTDRDKLTEHWEGNKAKIKKNKKHGHSLEFMSLKDLNITNQREYEIFSRDFMSCSHRKKQGIIDLMCNDGKLRRYDLKRNLFGVVDVSNGNMITFYRPRITDAGKIKAPDHICETLCHYQKGFDAFKSNLTTLVERQRQTN